VKNSSSMAQCEGCMTCAKGFALVEKSLVGHINCEGVCLVFIFLECFVMKLQKNRFLDPLFRKLSQMSFEQKIQSSFLTLLTLVLVFFPLVKFSPTSTEIA